jgi:hypothetical protein
LHADEPWDTLSIVRIIRGLLPLFGDAFPNPFRAKEFCSGISRVVDARNARSHQDGLQFTVPNIVDGIYQMMRILESIGKVHDPATSAAAKLNSTLKDVQRLLEMCPDDSGERNYWAPALARPASYRDAVILQREGEVVTLSKDAYNRQQLYLALKAWDVHLEADKAGAIGLCEHIFSIYASPLIMFN